jgi:hypothetical protein
VIDTHRIFKRLVQAGVSEKECEALVETARELSDSLTRADLHKELHAQTWRFFGIMGLMAALILSGMYYLLNDIKGDVREIRNRVAELSKHQ